MAEVKDKLLTAESLKYVYDSLSDDISKIKSEIDGGTSNDVTARAGQTVIVKEVDTNSNPTKWEAVEYQPRTHWAEYTELLPLTEVAPQLNENLGMAMSFLPICELIEGNWYKVTFDGVEYICQASFVSMADENGIAIGNKVLAGGADTGEPFGYVYMIEGYNPDGGYTTYDYNILFTMDTNPHAVQVFAERAHKIPTKFIPTLEEMCSEEVAVLPETSFQLEYGESITPISDIPIILNICETYKVTWNGVEYSCVPYITTDDNGDTLMVLGNYGASDLDENTASIGEPFCIVVNKEGGYLGITAATETVPDSQTVTLSIIGVNYTQIPKQCLTDAYPTAEVGQTIIVKEVDANGKPTAWKAVDYPLTETEIIPQTTYTAFYDYDLNCYVWNFENSMKLIAGQKYIVLFDGVKYTCTAKDVEAMGMSGTIIGNEILLGNDTGEPFGLVSVVGNDGNIVLFGFDGNEHTISLSGAMFDSDYLDLSWKPKKTANRGRMIIDATLCDGKGYNYASMLCAPITGESYIVTYNGTEYVCELKVHSYMYYIGNANMFGDGDEDTGEPFLVALTSSCTCVVFVSEGGAIISVQENFCYTPMPVEHFPNICIVDITTNGETEVLPEPEPEYDFESRITYIDGLATVFIQQMGSNFSDQVYSGRVLLKFRAIDGKVYIIRPAQWFIKNGDIMCSFLANNILYSLSVDSTDNAFSYFTYRKLTNEDSPILTSSTKGSTKKFRITVDDSGALTATEVTT